MDTTPAEQLDAIAEQARRLRAVYPDLFAFLAARDRGLQRMVARVPHPDDPEGWAPVGAYEQVMRQLHSLPPGVGELANRRA